MIVCRVCGYQNPDTEQFCENCHSFLEFTGEREGAAGTGTTGAAGGTSTGASGGATGAAGGGSASGGAGTGTAGGATGAGGPGVITDPGIATTTDAAMPPCPRCGTPNEPTRTFCKYCGERLTAATPVVEETARNRRIDPRLAIGGGVVVLAIVATVAFAAILNTARPAASPSPIAPSSAPATASLPTGSATPSASPSATASTAPTASLASAIPPAVTPSASESSSPSVSPSVSVKPLPTAPTSIAFYAVRNGQVDLFTVAPTGGAITDVTNDLAADSDPKWSPDGRRLAFDSRRDDNQRNIWVLEFDGKPNRLTHDIGANNAFPSWSPAGDFITYVHNGEIWVMNSIDGSNAHPLTTGADDSRPTWGTNGQILFHRTTPGNHEIWTVAADTTSPATVLIAIAQGGGRQPSWSPDGTRIAYAKVVNGVLRITVAAADGTGQNTITTGSPCPCQFPTWSPNGKQIAFSAGPSKSEQIYVVSASGGTPKRVTDGQGQNLAPGWDS